MSQPIPKIIHYCWFGGKPLPELAEYCIASWKKYCPDYEIRRWDESNFDLNFNAYVKEAYEAKKWAFLSDVTRLHALVTYGGIYMDTDVELLKPLDDLLDMAGVVGFEADNAVCTAVMACQPGQRMFSEFLSAYEHAHFRMEDGTLDLRTNVERLTSLLLKRGLALDNSRQNVEGLTFLPRDYFSPKNYETLELRLTENSYAIHHFNGSWKSDLDNYRHELHAKLSRYLPDKRAYRLALLLARLKYKGIGYILRRRVAKLCGREFRE